VAGGQECGGELLHGDGCCPCGEVGGDAVAEYRGFGWLHAAMMPRRYERPACRAWGACGGRACCWRVFFPGCWPGMREAPVLEVRGGGRFLLWGRVAGGCLYPLYGRYFAGQGGLPGPLPG